jgi:uncharacterized NAD-dependent epimerase/dehydratase family protein
MPASLSGALLFARLHVLAPDARVILIASVRSTVGISLVAESIAAAVGAANQPVRLVDAGGEADPFPGYTIIRGRGVLDDPQTVLSSAAADAVLLVAQPGHTIRADLEAARLQIQAEGGSLIGAILQP